MADGPFAGVEIQTDETLPRPARIDLTSILPSSQFSLRDYTKTYVDEKGIERSGFGVPTDPEIAHKEWVEMGEPRA